MLSCSLHHKWTLVSGLLKVTIKTTKKFGPNPHRSGGLDTMMLTLFDWRLSLWTAEVWLAPWSGKVVLEQKHFWRQRILFGRWDTVDFWKTIATLRSIESDDFRADYGPKYPLISEVLNTKHPSSFPASVCLAFFKKNTQFNMNQGRVDALFCQIAMISAAWLESNKQRLITAFHLQIKRVMNSGETLPPEFDLHDGDLCETAPICGFWVQIINLLLLADFCLFPK